MIFNVLISLFQRGLSMTQEYTSADFEWLNQKLIEMNEGDSLGERSIINIESLDGFLTGVSIGPNFIKPTAWLDEIIIDTSLLDKEAYSRFINIVTQMYNSICEARLGDIEFNILASDGQINPQFIRPVVWGYGLMRGIEANIGEPFELDMLPDRLIESANIILAPAIHKMTLVDIEDNRLPEYLIPHDLSIEEFQSNLEQELEVEPQRFHKALKKLSDYWFEESKTTFIQGNQTPVVNSVKVGRNDPCTCGSGKKFKKCCGK